MPRQQHGGKPRDPLWENVRYVAATVVLVGHAITPLRDQFPFMHWLYNATWQLGVPAFAFISGRFSTALPLTARAAGRVITGIAIPYAAFSLLTSLQLWILNGDWDFFVAEPVATLWFLLALIIWKVVLPYAVAVRYPLAWSVAAALAVGFAEDIGFEFAASQTITFFPFFYLGHLMAREQRLADAVNAVPRWAAALVTAALAGGAWLVDDRLEPVWLAMKRPYSADSYDLVWGLPVRAAVLLWGAVAVLALIRLVPRGHVPVLTSLGTAGLYIYLLHPLVLRQFHHVDFFARMDTGAEAAAVLAVALAATVVLGSRPVQWLARPFVQPRAAWLLRPAPGPAEQERTPAAPREPALVAPSGSGPAAPATPSDRENW
ncbi:acyltransferase family protein [Streptomyces sp. RFCAC02]|uniref:acyltransferase family protein n=1 Tax=Streptomyces sp. RFCAC02 TaxID=2499143 RepID=UPI00143E0B6C|nr:acyltransferase family protein [Streptomyces sp. RFCAC02]